MTDNEVPGAWPVWTPGAWLSGFIKRITEHCYTKNINALGLMVSEKKACVCFPIVSIWELMTPRVEKNKINHTLKIRCSLTFFHMYMYT